MIDLLNIEGFDWDKANSEKSWLKHSVADKECEEIFFNIPLLILFDQKHSQLETRYHALGQTNDQRLLFLSFTIRQKLLRIISARNMSKKERHHYEKAKKTS